MSGIETSTSACPEPEALAVLLDGGAEVRERADIMEHLDECVDCRSAVLDAGAYALETSGPVPLKLRQQIERSLPYFAAAAALVALAILMPGYAGLPGWFNGIVQPEVSTAQLAASVLAVVPAEDLDTSGWGDPRNSLRFASGLTAEQASFRLGARTLNLRISAAARNEEGALAAIDGLVKTMPMSDASELVTEWQGLTSHVDAPEVIVDSIEKLEPELRARLSPGWYELGAWAEAGRLANEYGDVAQYIRSDAFKTSLEGLVNFEFTPEVNKALEDIDVAVSGPAPSELGSLFSYLILSN